MLTQTNSATLQSRNLPTLRFPEYTVEWEVKKLGEVAEIIMGQSPIGDSYNYLGIGTALINGPVEFTEKYPVKTKWTSKPTKLCKDKDILFCVRGSTTGRMNISNDIYCIGRGVAAIRANKKSTTEFIELLIIKNLSGILTLTSGSTFFNLDTKSLKEYNVSFPTLPEQTKIASFLTAVDEKLQALKQKKNLLEQYKKGVMQQIFSQELRFKDDNGNDFPDWEEKKLGEVLSKNSNKNKRQKYLLVQSVSNKFGFINQDEMFEDRRVASKDTSNYYVIEKGHFAYNPSRIDVGSLAYKFDDEISVISPLYISFRAKDKFLKDDFLLNWFSSEQFLMQMNNSFEGSVRNTLSYVSLVKMEISIPTRHEQTKIANFLSAIDEKINHCQAQITNTEVWKKGLLQQLFI